MVLAKGRKVQRFARKGLLNCGVAASAVCYQGGLAVLQSGFVRPARIGQGGNDPAKQTDAATYRAVGVFSQSVTGTGVAGAVTVDVEEGVFLFKNSAGVDLIAAANRLGPCYVIDDETVALLSAGGTRPMAGIVLDVGTEGVWVYVSAETSALGQRVVAIPYSINQTDLLAPTNQQLVSPVSGRIIRNTVIVQAAVTTGGDITVISGAATTVVGLTNTIADAAAAGVIVTAQPTAGDATAIVTAGQRLQIAPGVPFATAGAVNGILEIAY